MLTIEQSISRLKINLVRKRPFYGVILMKLNDMKESNTTNIMSTDGENIYYNKKYMEQSDLIDKLNTNLSGEQKENFNTLIKLFYETEEKRFFYYNFVAFDIVGFYCDGISCI